MSESPYNLCLWRAETMDPTGSYLAMENCDSGVEEMSRRLRREVYGRSGKFAREGRRGRKGRARRGGTKKELKQDGPAEHPFLTI
jgi:hypothetical protein